jgi:hypothetical protein
MHYCEVGKCGCVGSMQLRPEANFSMHLLTRATL